MLVGHQPIVAVGPGTFLDDLLKIAGAENIADASAQQWPQLSIEYIVAMRPEVIIDGQMGSDPRVARANSGMRIPPFRRSGIIAWSDIRREPNPASGAARRRDALSDRETGSSRSMENLRERRAMNAALDLKAFEGAYLTRSRMVLALVVLTAALIGSLIARGFVRQRARSA